ncbi:DnaJ-domain-containing protein [Obba rivulosa]|uniref:DnaJ-domain-containing protein n=1 Tax=Obba rivulosa TaxID=1052685 RepID=A0A8E2DSI4_9APHY|nr:DnaJ-domain-containing protein [Obba rivulosa]
MGANASTGQAPDAEQNAAPAVPDYYTLLEVDEAASQDEIRRSFRRLALIHHPDKNHDDTEAATQRFAALQQAYEVLSDEQERAWYDSHRASLVPEPDAQTVFEGIKRGAPASRARDRGLTVRHLAQFLNTSIYSGFDGGGNSFFTIYRNLFNRLAHDESLYDPTPLPSFGDSTWPWVPPSKADEDRAARTFYTFWLNFATNKEFSWMDQWNISEAPDRQVRRLMERDNKKARDDARKEYNDTVRSLAMFLRKRDPRYKAHLARQAAASAQSSTPSGVRTPSHPPSHASPSPAPTFVPQEWQTAVRADDGDADLQWAAAEGADEEEWECVACGKGFRSEAAWDSHERSKKHLKAVEALRRQMLEEEQALGFSKAAERGHDPEGSESGGEDEGAALEDNETAPEPPRSPSPEQSAADVEAPRENGAHMEEDNFRKQLRSRKKKARAPSPEVVLRSARKAKTRLPEADFEDLHQAGPSQSNGRDSEGVEDVSLADLPSGAEPQLSKREKRRAKEAEKKARGEETQAKQRCNVCHTEFDSRTKLFSHISETGHAAAVPSDEPRGTKKGKKGKR